MPFLFLSWHHKVVSSVLPLYLIAQSSVFSSINWEATSSSFHSLKASLSHTLSPAFKNLTSFNLLRIKVLFSRLPSTGLPCSYVSPGKSLTAGISIAASFVISLSSRFCHGDERSGELSPLSLVCCGGHKWVYVSSLHLSTNLSTTDCHMRMGLGSCSVDGWNQILFCSARKWENYKLKYYFTL